jgi:hypothetical protein
MTLILTTITGMRVLDDIASLEDYTEVDGKTIYHLGSFNPKVDDVILDKKDVLLIQVTK